MAMSSSTVVREMVAILVEDEESRCAPTKEILCGRAVLTYCSVMKADQYVKVSILPMLADTPAAYCRERVRLTLVLINRM